MDFRKIGTGQEITPKIRNRLLTTPKCTARRDLQEICTAETQNTPKRIKQNGTNVAKKQCKTPV